MEKSDKIFVAGSSGMVGSAIIRLLKKEGYTNIITVSSSRLDLRQQIHVDTFFKIEKPDYVFLAAAKVGGILANSTYPAEFIYDNLMIQTNVIHSAYIHNVKKLLFLGSSCIYPKDSYQPIYEEYLLNGPLEETNEAYAIAKIAGLKMIEAYKKQYKSNFVSVMPTNLYGPNDNYDPKNSHAIPGMIQKFKQAKENKDPYVTLWGTGTALREFLHVDDLAQACFMLMNIKTDSYSHINIGSSSEISIYDLAITIKKIVDYRGDIVWTDSLDGVKRKLIDSTLIKSLGWASTINLEEGLEKVIKELN